jgi:hypothetical protein
MRIKGQGQSRVAASERNRISGFLSHKLNLIGVIVAGSGYRGPAIGGIETFVAIIRDGRRDR